jgi:flotillin
MSHYYSISKNSDDEPLVSIKTKLYIAGSAAVTLFCIACYHRYHVANPHEYLVKTGMGIPNMSVSKSTFQFPFQRIKRVSMLPLSPNIELHMMTAERIPFKLPMSINLVPFDPLMCRDSFIKYVTLMDADPDKEKKAVSVIETQTRIRASRLKATDIVSDKDIFRKTITEDIAEDLKMNYGIHLLNIGVEEISDSQNDKFFEQLKQRSLADAKASAQVSISAAQRDEDVGKKERESDSRIRTVELETIAVTKENENKLLIARSSADLAIKQAELKKQREVAELEAKMSVEAMNIDRQKDLEERKLSEQTSKTRQETMSKVQIDAEAVIKRADGEAYAKIRTSEGDADAAKRIADAHLYTEQRNADALLALKEKEALATIRMYEADAKGKQMVAIAEAEGIRAKLLAEADGIRSKLLAEADGLRQILDAKSDGMAKLFSNTDAKSIIQMEMLDKRVPHVQAEQQAKGMQNLNPKFTILQNSNNDNNIFGPIGQVFQSMYPVISFLDDRFGLNNLLGSKKSTDNSFDIDGYMANKNDKKIDLL